MVQNQKNQFRYTIETEALELISNHDKLPKDNKGEFDFYAIRFFRFAFINANSILLKFRHDCRYQSQLKEITLKINGVCGKIELYELFSETAFGLHITRSYATLNIQAHSLTKDNFKILDITAHGIDVLACNAIEFPENPYC